MNFNFASELADWIEKAGEIIQINASGDSPTVQDCQELAAKQALILDYLRNQKPSK